MILGPAQNVELTKVHYFEESYNNRPFVISREIFDNRVNKARKNVVHRKKLCGDKWILKINEIGTSTNRIFRWQTIGLALVIGAFLAISIAFGLYFTLRIHNNRIFFNKTGANDLKPKSILQTLLTTSQPIPKTTTTIQELKPQKSYCENCREICLKPSETSQPKCLEPLDSKDPTGCGGHCSINTQYCQLLDFSQKIYQCSNLKNTLHCPKGLFNCGNMCIKHTKRCDGTINCSNQSDEIDCECNLETHFRCGKSTQCLPKAKQCDGIVDCWDKSDEIHCQTQDCHKNGTIPCGNGHCIDKEKFCDGRLDCGDQSDEPQGCQLVRTDVNKANK